MVWGPILRLQTSYLHSFLMIFDRKYYKMLENILAQQFRQNIHYHADTQSMIVELTLTTKMPLYSFMIIAQNILERK